MKLKPIYIIALIAFFISCKSQDQENKALARVFDKYLYQSDLKGIIQPGTSVQDSIALTESYIDHWIKNQLLLQKADENLDLDKKQLDAKIENYRQTIILFEYENQIIKQKLDTSISQGQVVAYYNRYADNFILKHDIVRLHFVKIKANQARAQDVLTAFDDETAVYDMVASLCKKYAYQYSMDDSLWYSVDELQNVVTSTIANSFSKSPISINDKDSTYIYKAKIYSYKPKGSMAPISYVRNNIEKIILNKRKVDLIKLLHEEIYKYAFKNNDFEIYN